MSEERTRKGGTSGHTGAKIESWRAIFSPWESPLIFGRIRYGCGRKSNNTTQARHSLLCLKMRGICQKFQIPIRVSAFTIMSEERARKIKCNGPVDCCRRRLDGSEPLSAPVGCRCKRVPFGVPKPMIPTFPNRQGRMRNYFSRNHKITAGENRLPYFLVMEDEMY